MRRRCLLPGQICGTDIDDIFAYSTAKSVKIRDHRLGILYYSALVGVIGYIGVYSLAFNLGYLEFHTPTGVARFTLQQPVLNTINHTTVCDPSDAWCVDNYPPKSSLSYCCRQEGCKDLGDGACTCTFRPQFKNYNCSFYDGDSASVEGRSELFIITRVKQDTQVENASCVSWEADSCSKLWTLNSTFTSFVAGIDNFTVLIDHAVQVPSMGFSKQARQVHGFLRIRGTSDDENKLCTRPGSKDAPVNGKDTTTAPCYIQPKHPDDGSLLDVFEVATLLTAAEVQLDSESYAGSDHSARYEGMTMLLNIVWGNTVPWRGLLSGSPAAYYYYDAYAMPKNAYSTHKSNFDPDGTRRQTLSMHGILVQASVMGDIGAFNFNTMLIQLTASLTLLAVAGTSVNTIAQYLMRYRHYYSKAMIEDTADFDEIGELEEKTDDELREACERCNLFCGGDRVDLINRLLMNGVNYAEHVTNHRGSARSVRLEDGSADREDRLLAADERSVPLSVSGENYGA